MSSKPRDLIVALEGLAIAGGARGAALAAPLLLAPPAAQRELARELDELITGFLRETEGPIPIRNPAYNPATVEGKGR